MLRLVERDNQRPVGHPARVLLHAGVLPEAHGRRRRAPAYLDKARAAAKNVDRFPYREESEAPLAEAVAADPKDAVARFQLACLLYYPRAARRSHPAVGGRASSREPRRFRHSAARSAWPTPSRAHPVEKAAGATRKGR